MNTGGIELWGVRRPLRRRAVLAGALARLGAVAIGAGVVAGLGGSLLGLGIMVSMLVGGVVVVAVVGVVMTLAMVPRLPKGNRASLSRADEARLASIVEGVEPLLGLGATEVAVIESDAVNAALVRGRRGEPLVVLTAAAVRLSSSFELEALVVRTLAAWRLGLLGPLSLVMGIDRILGGGRRRPWLSALAWELDLVACAVTRYPPVVVRLLRRLAEEPPGDTAGLVWWAWAATGLNNEELLARADAIEDEPWATRRRPVDV